LSLGRGGIGGKERIKHGKWLLKTKAEQRGVHRSLKLRLRYQVNGPLPFGLLIGGKGGLYFVVEQRQELLKARQR
jgi:hypothetical protein